MNFLIIGPSWLGDMVMANSLVRVLKLRNPNANIDMVAPVWSEGIVSAMEDVRHTILLDVNHGEFGLKKRRDLAKSIKEKHYQQVFVLPNSFKSALLPYFAKIPKRTGFLGEMRFGLLNDIRTLDKKRYPLMVERFISLGFEKFQSFDVNKYTPKLTLPKTYQPKDFGLPNDKKILALAPGAAFGDAKCWPKEKYLSIAKHYLGEGWSVVLLGSKNEKEIVSFINQGTDNACIDLAGITDLVDTVGVLLKADLMLGNDSGLMHVAAACDTPVLVVYGPTSDGHTPPLGLKSKTISLNLACSPCFKRTCPLGHHKCMQDLTKEQVLDGLEELHS